MSYVSPKIQEKLESLEPELREEILSRNVRLETLGDLIARSGKNRCRGRKSLTKRRGMTFH